MSKKILVLIAVIIIEGCSIGNNVYRSTDHNCKIGDGISGEATVSRDVTSEVGYSIGLTIFPESSLSDEFKPDKPATDFYYNISSYYIKLSETWASVKYYPFAQSLNIYPYVGGGLGYCLLQTSTLPMYHQEGIINGQIVETAGQRQAKDVFSGIYCRAEGGLVFHPFRSIIDSRWGKNIYISGSIYYDFSKNNANINLDGYQISLKVGYAFYFDN